MPLDPAQRAVAELARDASGVVVGSPGSGKTEVLIERVRHLVAGGFQPDEVLVLTPSRPAATLLRDRLALAVGMATGGAMARSVAAFAYQLVRAHAVHTGQESPQLLTGPDDDQLIADLLAGDAEDEASGSPRWPDWLPVGVRATAGFRAELRTFLAECTTLGIEPGELDRGATRHDIEVWHAAASFAGEYHAVRDRLRGAHRDAAGLVREAVGLVRTLPDASPALGVLTRLRVLLVDDAQELTLGGVELLEACRARGVAVLAFGDPDVGSGSFRGATPENFARLAASGPIHVLGTPHRGTAAQQALVASVTSHIGAVGVVAHRRPPLPATPDDSIRVLAARSPAEEQDLIARLLRERHVHEAVPWRACAVIAHDTRQVATLEAELAAREVPTRATGQGRPLAASSAVRDLLRRVLLALEPPDTWAPADVADALRGGGMDPVEIRRLRTALRQQSLAGSPADGVVATGAELLASGLAHPLEFALIDTREGRRAEKIARAVDRVRVAEAAGATAHELLWEAWDGVDGDRVWGAAAAGTGPAAAQAGRELDAVVELFQAAKRHGERADGTSPVSFLRGILDSDVAEDRLRAAADDDVVQILTPAGALGLEFDTVVVAGVQDGVWPNLRSRGSLLETWRLGLLGAPDEEQALDAADRRRALVHDELRLFARACSRARSLLVVTAVDDDDTGPSPLFELLPDALPPARGAEHPLTLRGAVARHRRTLTESRAGESARRHAADQLVVLAEARVAGAAPDSWYGVSEPTSTAPLRDLAREDVRVSPSRLDALERCELDWVIADLGADAGGTTAGVGTIIHAAMEQADGIDEASLWEVVAARWGELDFESAWRDRAEQARAKALVRRLALYLQRFEASGGTLIGAEPHFEVEIPVEGDASAAGEAPAAGDVGHAAEGRVIVSGYIDRVERTGTGKIVIVDLKTGKNEPQTDAKVTDNPQLAAYQLALASGSIPEATDGEPGGAKLLVLRPTAATKDYAEPTQPPMDDEARAAFLGRVRSAVDIMRGTSFTAPFEEHCRDDFSHGLCRIHTIGPVSAS